MTNNILCLVLLEIPDNKQPTCVDTTIHAILEQRSLTEIYDSKNCKSQYLFASMDEKTS